MGRVLQPEKDGLTGDFRFRRTLENFPVDRFYATGLNNNSMNLISERNFMPAMTAGMIYPSLMYSLTVKSIYP